MRRSWHEQANGPASGLLVRSFIRWAALAFYYLFASRLPDLPFPGGRFFNAVRCMSLRAVLPRLGERNEIDGHVYIGDGSDVYIGSRCQINRGCRLSRVIICDYVMIAPDAIVLGKLHNAADGAVPMVEQGEYTKAPTCIEDNVWLGTRAIIMPGVTIGTGSIVGAGAVVTRDVAPWTVVGGVPARPIRDRRPGAGELHRGGTKPARD